MSEVTGYSTEGWNGPLVLAGGAGGSLQWPHILWGLSVIFESILDLEEKDGAPLLTDPWKRPRFTPWRAVGGTEIRDRPYEVGHGRWQDDRVWACDFADMSSSHGEAGQRR